MTTRKIGAAAAMLALVLAAGCESPSSPHEDATTTRMRSREVAPPAPPVVTATSWNGITMPADALPYDRGEETASHRLTFTFKRDSTPAWADKGGIEAWIYTRAVRNIQQHVGVAADGIYGPRTEQAVKNVQFTHDLIVDGEVGPDTSRALGMDWNADVDYG